MGIKTKGLQELLNKGINVHDFTEQTSYLGLVHYILHVKKCTLRFDPIKSAQHCLPFYVLDENMFICTFYDIAKTAKAMGCTMLCSDGIKYDDIQIANFVLKIEYNGDFILEYSNKKVPLRKMYEYPTTTIRGNIGMPQKEFEVINKVANRLDRQELEDILMWGLKIKTNQYIEGTLYPDLFGI